jgi:ParB-like chromosome segregation protein Spo0J
MATTNSQRLDLNALPAHTVLGLQIDAAGIHRYVIAQRLGLSEGQLSKILNGRRPLDDLLIQRIRDAIAQGAAA